MNGKNEVQLVGYVGQDLKETKSANGYRVAIRVATHHNFTDKTGNLVDEVTWHNVVAWDATAEFARRNFVKGSKIMAEGRIVYGNFTGTDGLKHKTAHIRANSLQNLDR